MFTLNNSVLYQKAQPVTFENPEELDKLGRQMEQLMLTYRGIGLAAPQCGISKCIVVTNVGKLRRFYNPKIVASSSNTILYNEGCLSFPGLYINIRRPVSVEVEYQDITGNSKIESFDGLEATCIQHEIDHLNGITFQAKASKLALDISTRRMKKRDRHAVK